MTFEHLLIERDGRVLNITINRPGVLNALSIASLRELDRAMSDAAADASLGAIVLTGAGDRAFAAGADLRELSAYSPADARQHARDVQTMFTRIERLGTPVIAAVNGFALGGGCELALSCAIRLASASARFGQPEINLGIIPGYGGTLRLQQLVGRGAALEMLLSGESIDAARAFQLGLVSRVVPAESLLAEARALAAMIAAKPTAARRCLVDAVAAAAELATEAAQEHEAALFGLLFSTDDMREGTRAFLEKRAPVFKGR
jgi:enoyl-CoA hydratase